MSRWVLPSAHRKRAKPNLEAAAINLRRAACDYASALLQSVPVRQELAALGRLYEAARAYAAIIESRGRK